MCPATRFFAVETISSFWWDLENFHKKVCPVTRFFAVESILSFWGDLESFDKKVWPVTHFFFAVQTILCFWWDLEKFSQKSVPSYTFFRSACYLKFWIGLRKVSTKMCAQLHIFSLWRLTWVFDGTWNNFHKKVYPVICFFALETNLSFWWDLEKFSQKSVPSHTFLRCGDYLKFLRGLRKILTKKCA